MTDDERTINSLEFRLSRALDDARRAQAALTTARRRLGLFDPRQFFDAADMDRALAESRAEMRAIVSAAISDCRMRWDATYRPTSLEKAMTKWPAAFAVLDAAKKTDNVVPLPTGQTAEQIIAAGRRRRGEDT
jgi:hypothetical protein